MSFADRHKCKQRPILMNRFLRNAFVISKHQLTKGFSVQGRM